MTSFNAKRINLSMEIIADTFTANPSQIPATSPVHKASHWFNSETSKVNAEKSRLKRIQLREQAKANAEKLRLVTPQSQRLSEQIASIEALMRDEKDPDALSKLSMAHSRLFGAWQVLMAVPNPGSRRAKSVRSSPILEVAPISPVEPVPQAVVVEPVSKVYTGPENG